jgi:hypothetical protein
MAIAFIIIFILAIAGIAWGYWLDFKRDRKDFKHVAFNTALKILLIALVAGLIQFIANYLKLI